MTLAHVITGSFGAGKTTAIRRLMADKPPQELWIVVLNEFTEAGIDALTVAQAARGEYGVRLVAGGCLCCVGELEFAQQLRDILRNFKPARLLVEPSGAGHAADIVDALALYERQKALVLESVICLIDPQDAVRILNSRPANEWSQIQSADVLLLSKPDVATPAERAAFDEIAAAQYPAKSLLGESAHGQMPAAALSAYGRSPRFSLMEGPGPDALGLSPAVRAAFEVAGLTGNETQQAQLGLWAIQWTLPSELLFARVTLEPRLHWLLETYQGWVRRMKAVFRTGRGPSWLVQSQGRGMSGEDSAHRRDSRLEIVLTAAPTEAFLNEWRRLLRDAANPRNPQSLRY
jgi:G3E family GTPase